MALDGAVDPALDPVVAIDQQSVGFEGQLSAFLSDCATSPTCPWTPTPRGDLHAAYTRLIASIRAHPLAVGGRRLGPGEAFLGVAAGLYDRHSWPVLAAALARAGAGDGGPLLDLFDSYVQRRPDGTYSDTLEANTAITCADEQWPTNLAAFARLAADAARQAPDFGAANLWGNLSCAVWPFHTSARPHPLVAQGSPPIIVVGTTGDPATPLAWARSLAHELQHGVLVTRVGDGHTAYAVSACVRGHVDAYLLHLTVPSAGATCPS
jgi:hypothetical protein